MLQQEKTGLSVPVTFRYWLLYIPDDWDLQSVIQSGPPNLRSKVVNPSEQCSSPFFYLNLFQILIRGFFNF
ncbi:MAG: hypothetical protein EOO44_13200 [Flavobacterium sp.]|nr:MAG: hypothetical protein EOO44_13200 [Flavobacterium sp.]